MNGARGSRWSRERTREPVVTGTLGPVDGTGQALRRPWRSGGRGTTVYGRWGRPRHRSLSLGAARAEPGVASHGARARGAATPGAPEETRGVDLGTQAGEVARRPAPPEVLGLSQQGAVDPQGGQLLENAASSRPSCRVDGLAARTPRPTRPGRRGCPRCAPTGPARRRPIGTPAGKTGEPVRTVTDERQVVGDGGGRTPNLATTPSSSTSWSLRRSSCTTWFPARMAEILVRRADDDLLDPAVVTRHGRRAGQSVVCLELHHGPHDTPMASRASSRGRTATQVRGTPSQDLYPGHMPLRKDSITWSVATARWVALAQHLEHRVSTPRVAATSPPPGSDGAAPK